MKLFILALLIGPVTLLGQRITVAVLDFDALGISEVEAAALSNRLRNELFNLGKFSVVERGMMDDVLREQDFQQSGCTSNECLVEVGMLLGAELMIGGSVSKVGRTFTVSARLVDVESGELLMVADFDLVGEIDDVLTKGMSQVALKLSSTNNAMAGSSTERLPAMVTSQESPPPNITDQNISLRFGIGIGTAELRVPQPKRGNLSFSIAAFYRLSPTSSIGVQFLAIGFGSTLSLSPVYVYNLGGIQFQLGLSAVYNDNIGQDIADKFSIADNSSIYHAGITAHIGAGYEFKNTPRNVGIQANYNFETNPGIYLSGGAITLGFDVIRFSR